jgi:hypothetical protein
VVFLPVEVVVLARFWRLGVVLVLVVSFLRFGSDGDGCRFWLSLFLALFCDFVVWWWWW